MIINYASWLRWRIAEYAATSRYHIYIFTIPESEEKYVKIYGGFIFSTSIFLMRVGCVCVVECTLGLLTAVKMFCDPRSQCGILLNGQPSTWSFKTTTSTLHNCTNLPRIFKIVDGDSPEVKLAFWTCDRYQSLLSLITFRACKKDFDNSIHCLNS